MNHLVKLISKKKLNHDVIRFHFQRPTGHLFAAGQATELFITDPEKKGPGPFTFTGLNREPNLELTIKIYNEHKGLTASLARLDPDDEVYISDAWDSFTNKGPGVFIAGGAGITPFIALLRQMRDDGTLDNSHLYFSNKTRDGYLYASGIKVNARQPVHRRPHTRKEPVAEDRRGASLKTFCDKAAILYLRTSGIR